MGEEFVCITLIRTQQRDGSDAQLSAGGFPVGSASLAGLCGLDVTVTGPSRPAAVTSVRQVALLLRTGP